jgi:GntR family transcriptional regulator
VTYDRQIASIFGLPSTVPFLRIVRIRRGDGIPLSLETAWYNLDAAPGVVEFDGSGSIYTYIGQVCGQPLAYCDQTIEAAQPTPDECAVFGLDLSVPCLLIKRRSHTQMDTMIEYVEGLFRGDMYRYQLRLST